MALAAMRGQQAQETPQRSRESPMDIEWDDPVESHLHPRKRAHDDDYTPMQVDTPVRPAVQDVQMTQASPLAEMEHKRRRSRNNRGHEPLSSSSDDEDADEKGPLSIRERARGAKFNFTVHHHHGISPAFGVNPFALNSYGTYGPAPPPKPDPVERIPHTAMDYVKLTVVALGTFALMWAVFIFARTLRRDVQIAVYDKMAQKQSEIAACAKLYFENRCDPASRIPMAEKQCQAWELCMNQHPTSLPTMRVLTETLAQVVNGFVDEVSWKVIFCVLVLGAIFSYSLSSALVQFAGFRSAESRAPSSRAPPHVSWPPSDWRWSHERDPGGRDYRGLDDYRGASEAYLGGHPKQD